VEFSQANVLSNAARTGRTAKHLCLVLLVIAIAVTTVAGIAAGAPADKELSRRQAVPPPAETPVELIVSGRTSTLRSITIVELGQTIPPTFAGENIKNTKGFSWYASRHFALKSNMDENFSRYMLTIAELAYPHYRWVFGAEPKGIETTRLPFVYAKTLDDLQRSVRDDIDSFWAGSGGGVTLNHKVAYNYPSGTLTYHKRDLVMHENLHLYHICLAGSIDTPPRLTEGIAHAFANHVYDEQKKQLTVMVLDKATTNNPYDRAMRALQQKPVTMQEFIRQGAGGSSTWALYTQFFWTDPDRLMKWRIWCDELLRTHLKGQQRKQLDARLMEELFGPIEQLNRQWEQWLAQRRSTFHYVAWGWEQDADTLWSYGFGPQRFSRTDIQFAPNEQVRYDPLRMDYPAKPMPALMPAVRRGVAEPVVGCVVDFSRCPQRGVAGLGLGVEQEKLLAVLVRQSKELLIDGGDLGMPDKTFPFAEEFSSAMAAGGHRVALAVRIARQALQVTLRAGKQDELKEMDVSIAIDEQLRRRLMTRHMAILAMDGWHGVTPFIDDARRPPPDLSVAAPMGRWRFAGERQLYGLYRAAWRLGKDAPPSLGDLKQKMARAADKDPATQQAAIKLYRQRIDGIMEDVAAIADPRKKRLALAELTRD